MPSTSNAGSVNRPRGGSGLGFAWLDLATDIGQGAFDAYGATRRLVMIQVEGGELAEPGRRRRGCVTGGGPPPCHPVDASAC